jgi:hypothetical protein
MIRAVVACASGDGPPPPVLTLAWQCAAFNALPNAGGLGDQPAGLIAQMTAARNIYTAWSSYTHALRKSEWIAANPDGWRIVQEVINGRLHTQPGD